MFRLFSYEARQVALAISCMFLSLAGIVALLWIMWALTR